MISNTLFIIIIAAIGFLLKTYFNRLKESHDKNYPEKDKPVSFWLLGRNKNDKDSEN